LAKKEYTNKMLQTDDLLEEELFRQLREWKDKHALQLFPMRNKSYGGVSVNGGGVA
jgi:hypothetical protein